MFALFHMLLQMEQQCWSTCKHFSANDAFRHRITALGIVVLLRHMMNELCWICEWLIAPFARVRFSRVEEHVLVEIRLLTVGLLAIWASKLLLTLVHLHMHRQTGCLCECFVTLFARKWFFARVNPHMRGQRTWLSKSCKTRENQINFYFSEKNQYFE